MRKLVFITLVVLFSSIYYYSSVENENSLAFQIKTEIKTLVGTATRKKPPTENQIAVPQNESASGAGQQTGFGVDLGALNETQLSEWIREESKSMDMTNNDTEQVEIKMRASAKTLQSEQLKFIGMKALDVSVPANERILSAYLLTLNSNPESSEVQYNLAKEPLPDFGPVTAHSEAELRRTQEIALRYMVVDELAERAKTDANARHHLKLLLNPPSSEEVRRYVQRKIKELSL